MAKETMVQNSGWCFAMVNGKLAEIYFKKGIGIYGYCYAERETYSKSEQRMIDADLKKYKFTYRNGYYFDQTRKTKQKVPKSITEVFPEVNKGRRADTTKVSGR